MNTKKQHPLEDLDFFTEKKKLFEKEKEKEKEQLPSQLTNVTPLYRNEDLKDYDSKYEKPIHRIMCYRSASGDTPQEIADATGYSVVQVRNILKADHSVLLIAQIIADTHNNDVSLLIKGKTVEAITTITNLMHSAKSETVKLNSAKDILDRYRGKPGMAQLVDPNYIPVPTDPREELEKINAELALIRNQTSPDDEE